MDPIPRHVRLPPPLLRENTISEMINAGNAILIRRFVFLRHLVPLIVGKVFVARLITMSQKER